MTPRDGAAELALVQADGAALAPAQRGQAIAQCWQTLAAGSKSFAMAARVLPPRCRDEAAVVYSWCRRADDAVDLAPPAEQPAALARLRAELDGVYAGQAQDDLVLAAFQEVVARYRIPREYPAELLAGMEMDVLGQRYPDMHTLLCYCYRVASTVGLMMSHVMGVTHDGALRNAAHLGMAMQLTNICRDVLEDWGLGRLYVPAEVLADCGIEDLGDALGGPFPARARAPMRQAVARLLREAERFYRSGDRGLLALPWRCAFGVRAARPRRARGPGRGAHLAKALARGPGRFRRARRAPGAARARPPRAATAAHRPRAGEVSPWRPSPLSS
jgi:phytoene synthase